VQTRQMNQMLALDENASSISETQMLVIEAIQAGVPPLIIGEPGTGKTSMVRGVAEYYKVHLEVILGSIIEPADIGGMPVVDHNTTVDIAGQKYPSLRMVPIGAAVRASLAQEGCIIFLDELNTAPPAVFAALLRVALEKRFGEHQMPFNKTAIVAAMNPVEMAAGGNVLPPALANRFEHIPMKVNAASWASNFRTNFRAVNAALGKFTGEFQVGVIDEAEHKRHRDSIASFIERRPDLLLSYPEQQADASGPWASPRSIENASKCLAVCKDENRAFKHVEYNCGRQWATEYFTWLGQQQSLVNPEEALANPMGFDMPKRIDQRTAMIDAIARAIEDKIADDSTRTDRVLSAWMIVKRFADTGHRDLAAHLANKLIPIHTKYSSQYRGFPVVPNSTMNKIRDLM
jgi:hypothetical protein